MWQQVLLIGNLGKDPEMRYMQSGKAVTNFSMATSKKWKNNEGEEQEKTVWWRVSAFDKLGEIANDYLKKGSKVLVIGEMNADAKGNPRVYKRNDGEAASSFEIVANTIKFLSPKGEGNGHSHAAADEDETEGF